MTDEFKRFNKGDEVVAYYRPIAEIEGEIYMTPDENPENKCLIEDKDGELFNQKPEYVKRKGCDHKLLYSKTKGHFCPFCDTND